ncbi:MAG: PepSY-associated TM helix domain-containing protein [Planctomycetales bacterium]|nr:PepSY-associated TM helix domain-containing protein [Planctomycetales bacterium]
MWRQVASWTRWLHIYASMFGFATIFFFGVTGLTLNHPAWFFAESTVQYSGLLNQAWLNTEATPPEGWDEYDYSHLIDKLSVAEHLRAEHRLRGAVEDFLAFEDQCEVTFAGPGYAATARIIRDTGAYTVDVTANDLVSVINDLHKGRHSGKAWSWVIDISAILSVFVSATGFLLIFFLRLRCRQGLVVATVGLALLGVFYYVARM